MKFKLFILSILNIYILSLKCQMTNQPIYGSFPGQTTMFADQIVVPLNICTDKYEANALNTLRSLSTGKNHKFLNDSREYITLIKQEFDISKRIAELERTSLDITATVALRDPLQKYKDCLEFFQAPTR